MLETVKLVAQRLIAPREPRLLDTQCPTDSCRKHWEMAPFLARLVVMKRWKSLSRLTFPPVMDMGKITGAWERSKDKGKLPPPPAPVLTGEWQVVTATGAEPLSEEDVVPPLDHSVTELSHLTVTFHEGDGFLPCLTHCLTGSAPCAQHPYPNHKNACPVWNSKCRTGRKWRRDCLEYHPPCD